MSFVYPASDWYSVSVSIIIYVISYNIGLCYNGTWLYHAVFPVHALSRVLCIASCTFYLSFAPWQWGWPVGYKNIDHINQLWTDDIITLKQSATKPFPFLMWYTIQTPHNMVYFTMIFHTIYNEKCRIQIRPWTHKKHCLPRPHRRAMECHLWLFWRKLTMLYGCWPIYYTYQQAQCLPQGCYLKHVVITT